jgi:amphi-Trp domain-containing protein
VPKKKPAKRARDIEKGYPKKQFIAKLRRLADTLETGGRFRIAVAGERVDVPADVEITVEHEREGGREELEFQLVWSTKKS